MREAKERDLVPELATLAAASRSEALRTRILGYLGEIEDPAARATAIEILAAREESSPALLRAALGYLSAIKDREALPDVASLAESTDESVALAAVTALGRIGAQESAGSLLELHGRDTSTESVRHQIILALGEIGARDAVTPLLAILEDTATDRVSRMYAAASLGKIGDAVAVDSLTAALSEPDAMLRAYVAAALGRLRAPGVADTLGQALRDASWQVRLEAARAIADGAAEGAVDDEIVGMLMYRARRDEVAQVRRETIRALGTLGRREGFDLLRELYADGAQPLELRGAALAVLIRSDLARSMDTITGVVDGEWSSRTQRTLELSATQLSEAVAPEISGLLGRFLGSSNLAVRVAGIRGVARNGLKQYAEDLRTAAEAQNTFLRREALSALEKLGLTPRSSTE
jgi:HEAT repeat protein